jgi:hypothetical protein
MRWVTLSMTVITLVLNVAVLITPASATSAVTYISSTGSDSNPCTAAQPCATPSAALSNVGFGGQINCLDAPGWIFPGITVDKQVTIDCAGFFWATAANSGAFQISQNVIIRNLTINGENIAYPAIKVNGGNLVVLENCTFLGIPTGSAIDVEPNSPLTLVIRNSRILGNGAGVLLKPAAAGTINAILDHVVISDNGGGGIKTDSTNGVVNLDVSDTEIYNNSGNGINAVAGTIQNMVSIKNSVIAKNAVAGVQANGANAGVTLQTTLLDQNATGATSVVAGGHIITYGNNSIVGSAGSGFTGSAPLQ